MQGNKEKWKLLGKARRRIKRTAQGCGDPLVDAPVTVQQCSQAVANTAGGREEEEIKPGMIDAVEANRYCDANQGNKKL